MSARAPLADRLGRTVLYQVYPQSYADADGDGMGDLAGLAARLDYLAWLGVDAVWISPCFVSPFRDAGYDVADFLHIAPRYGGDAAFDTLIAEADRLGIAVLFDLVAGHTSDEHPWFRQAIADPGDDRFVFHDAPGPRRNRDALVQIMRHWLDRGVQGFRVDMAASLVKDDPGHVETARLWRDVRARIEQSHPGRVLISEWGDPARAVPAGFDVDFFLQFGGDFDGRPLKSLWNNGSGTVHEAWDDEPAWADAAGRGDAGYFVAQWREARAPIEASGSRGLVGLPTSNHDFTRLVSGDRDAVQARSARPADGRRAAARRRLAAAFRARRDRPPPRRPATGRPRAVRVRGRRPRT
ncbi:alpha-amylase family glycosyl hydrolase [Microbacterium telephonicum]|uniref:Alpha amylase catalytic subunit n=1 Tax=Microbacterium telephonicum TaxID=1714841 RepID=A0A498CA50_9MICO|nr:alpha-amylase family glycosyl hydrolase [Microbacterium telephonicum]RLK52109.1 alpha amylase catalytic subunit [Microbacterium telephonicum]